MPGSTLFGSQPSASNAIFGNLVAKSLKPGSTDLPAHTGQPVPLFVLEITVAEYLCPSGQIQDFFLLEPL